MKYRALITIVVFLLIFSGFVFSESADRIVLQRIESSIKLDGLSDEPGWEKITPLPLIQHAPNFGEEPSERSVVLVAHDDDYLYLAGRLYDSEPSKILGATDWPMS